jgi:hypothetical protein
MLDFMSGTTLWHRFWTTIVGDRVTSTSSTLMPSAVLLTKEVKGRESSIKRNLISRVSQMLLANGNNLVN